VDGEGIPVDPGLVVHGHVIPGPPAEGILQVADEVSADLIVVGNKGMRGAAHPRERAQHGGPQGDELGARRQHHELIAARGSCR
jgi:nucleotide-binding universal stress UspA family protein